MTRVEWATTDVRSPSSPTRWFNDPEQTADNTLSGGPGSCGPADPISRRRQSDGSPSDVVRSSRQRRQRTPEVLQYVGPTGDGTERTVRPLGVFFWGRTWTLAAWCELRNDFRNFRLDRANELVTLEQTFDEEPGKTLRDLLTRYGPEAVKLLD